MKDVLPNATSAGPEQEAYQKPKDWESLSVEEKVERMRGIIHSLQDTISSLEPKLRNVRFNLKNHMHLSDKVVVVKEAQLYDDTPKGIGVPVQLHNKYF